MAELGISIAGKLIEVIGSAVIKEICDAWGYKSQLEDLSNTVITIKNVLLDADSKRELSHEARSYIEELKAAVYDADDLFDEFFTLAKLKQLDAQRDDKFVKKVRRFFSTKKKGVTQAHRMSNQVKDIKEKLDDIVINHQKFGLCGDLIDHKPICKRREETCSYLLVNNIIGRENDKKAVKGMLLGSNSVHEDVCFVTMVGVGGLGKTALAQLVYNDESVVSEFSELRWWVCVSDQDGEQLDVKAILCKILELVSGKKPDGTSSLEWVQNQLQQQLRGKKYLLVLDDVWNEDRRKWLSLKDFLMVGQRGSRIVVTTRSEMTAKIIGEKHIHKLEGLSQEYSWLLFVSVAFDKDQEHVDQFVEIGKRIVEKCYNNPLAIKVVGSLLFGQHMSKWKSFEQSGLAGIDRGKNEIMSVLKLSYHNLRLPLKNCFSYCAVFPKDFEIRRETLISLWMAQGYIVPLDGGQSIEDAGEEYFLILLRRCFFQDIKKDGYGDVISIKIHDLMHDVAQEVGRKEIGRLGSNTSNLEDKIRHVHYVGDECHLESFVFKNNIRSFFYRFTGITDTLVGTEIKNNFRCLRVLHFENACWKTLPDSIGKLLHLRYLNLSGNRYLETLCDPITELHNLETLILDYCFKLREFPGNFSKLVNLRHLSLERCYELRSHPSGMKKLTSLIVTDIQVGENGMALKDLEAIPRIKGQLFIYFRGDCRNKEGLNDAEVWYLKRAKHLTALGYAFERATIAEGVMEKLEPPKNLRNFTLDRYKGKTIPGWGRAEDNWALSLPYLVHIQLVRCRNLEQIPSLSKLRFLKSVALEDLDSVEYIETRSSNTDEGEDFTTFFPSLESLVMQRMKNMKGWWKSVDDDHIQGRRLAFPRVSKLVIYCCRSLLSFPHCPSLEDLVLMENTVESSSGNDDGDEVVQDGVSRTRRKHSFLVGIVHDGVKRLRRLGIDRVDYLRTIVGDDQSSIFEDQKDGNSIIPWKSLDQSLRDLKFEHLKDRHMPIAANDVQYLTSLQILRFHACSEMEDLPEWIGSLSSLQFLSIQRCSTLKSLPESILKLTSLQRLEIFFSKSLQQRCRKPNGEEWPKIQYIPDVSFEYGYIAPETESQSESETKST